MTTLLSKGARLGAFEIEGYIAKGGMGAVYAARNVLTGEKRALKVMLPELVANKEFVERFVREVRLAMIVQHPNLVRVFEPGLDGETVFLPMELLAGETLKTRLERVKKLPPGEAVALLSELCTAVGALHAAGIVHRDIKPSNIFLAVVDGKLVPKLLDLGAARDLDVGSEATASIVVGSAHYMSPEQAAGRKLDARTDQYSLGVAAYQVLTGVRPYENDTTGHAMAKVLAGAPFKKPREIDAAIPEALERAVMRALERDPAARYGTMKDMADALRASIEDDKTIMLPELPAEDATRIHPLEAAPAKPPPAPIFEPPSGTAAPSVVATQAAPSKSNSILVAVVVGAIAVVGVAFALNLQKTPAAPAVPSEPPKVVTAPPPPPSVTMTEAPIFTAPPVTATPSATVTEPAAIPSHVAHARDAGAVGKPHVDAGASTCVPSPGSPCL